jgi:hypothetical protein
MRGRLSSTSAKTGWTAGSTARQKRSPSDDPHARHSLPVQWKGREGPKSARKRRGAAVFFSSRWNRGFERDEGLRRGSTEQRRRSLTPITAPPIGRFSGASPRPRVMSGRRLLLTQCYIQYIHTQFARLCRGRRRADAGGCSTLATRRRRRPMGAGETIPRRISIQPIGKNPPIDFCRLQEAESRRAILG